MLLILCVIDIVVFKSAYIMSFCIYVNYFRSECQKKKDYFKKKSQYNTFLTIRSLMLYIVIHLQSVIYTRYVIHFIILCYTRTMHIQ